MGKFEKSLAFGQMGESAISRWLQSRGHSVFPAYQIEHQTGKGPQLFSASGDLVLPDLLAFRSGKAHWFEAKHKTCFTWHRNTAQWTTGVDLRHYGEYQKVALRTSLPVWLLFWHPKGNPDERDLAHGCPTECPSGLFGGDISNLAQCVNHSSTRWGSSGMVYWSAESLIKLADSRELM